MFKQNAGKVLSDALIYKRFMAPLSVKKPSEAFLLPHRVIVLKPLTLQSQLKD
ncbi:hypothetical protein PROPEN_03512 [Proteus penneri ATCC 35198]|nr:hypothetical protein PROPEN_03512 [Proteus penneri ATCC 35198]